MENNNSKMWLGVALVAAAVGLLAWMWWAQPAAAPESETGLSATDTTLAIDQELQATDLGSPADELKTTDADLNAL